MSSLRCIYEKRYRCEPARPSANESMWLLACPVMDMIWGDRCGTVVDPDGYAWMVGTHKAEPTAKEMKKGMEEMMKHQPAGAAAAD